MSEYTSPMRADVSYTSLLIPRDELREITIRMLRQGIQNAQDDPDRVAQLYKHIQSVDTGLSGVYDACADVARDFYSSYEDVPKDPRIALNWYYIAYQSVDDENWYALRGMPGSSREGVEDWFMFEAATMLIHIPEYQYTALNEMIWYVRKYVGYRWMWGMTADVVRVLCGVSPHESLRTPEYDLSALKNLPLAQQYYNLLADPEGYNQPDEELAALVGVPYVPKAESSSSSSSSSSGGCYIATCVYGSYDCPEVWTLRRFRDDVLRTTAAGRLFIRAYYAVSPTLVRWFGKASFIRRTWKALLDPMVAQLQRMGLSSERYEDR